MTLDFVDKGFDLRRISYYRLSIQISLSGFSFCIVDIASRRHVVLREHRYKKNVSNYNMLCTEVAAIIASDTLLQAPYPACDCMYVSPQNTFIPESFFSEQALRSYLGFVHPLDELDEIHSTKVESMEAYNIFTLPSPLATLIKDKFKQVRFINQARVLLHTAMQKNEEQVACIDFHQNFIDVVVQKGKKLMLCNAFDTVGITDAIYYLTTIIQKLQLQPETGYYISGEVSKDDVGQLSSYYPSLQVDNHPRMSLLIGLERSSRFNSLLMLNECV